MSEEERRAMRKKMKQRHEKMMKMSEEQRQAMPEKRSEKAGMNQ